MEHSYNGSDRELTLWKSMEIPAFKIQMAPPPAPERTPPAPDTSLLLEFARVIARRKWLLLGMVIAGMFGGLLVALIVTPMFRAKAVLEVRDPNDSFMLQNDVVVERVVAKLKLDQRSTSLFGRGLLARIKHPFGRQENDRPSREAAIDEAASHLEIRSGNHSIEIAFDAADPQLAADFANAAASEVIEEYINSRREVARETSDSLERQLAELKTNYERSENQLREYARSSGLSPNPDENSTAADETLSQMQQEMQRVQADVAAKRSKYELAQAGSAASDASADPTLTDYQSKLADLKRQLTAAEATAGPTYYKAKNLRAEIAELETAIRQARATALDRLRDDYQAAVNRQRLLQKSYGAQNRLAAAQTSRLAHYDALKREAATSLSLYEAALEKANEARMSAAVRTANIRMVSAARRPLHPYRPSPLFDVGMGLLTGLLLGLAAVFVRDKTDRKLRSPGDIAAYLNLPELAAVPSAELEAVDRHSHRRGLAIDLHPIGESNNKAARQPVEMVSCRNERSPMAESFRAALASLWFAGQNGRRPRIIVLTSPNPQEGKTILTSNLGIALANTNRRVLLIDGDLRKPRLHDVFSVSNAWGLGNLLEDDYPVEDYIFEEIVSQTGIPGLFVLPAGSGEVNVSSLRYDERLADLLARFRLEFHAVLIDTPPMLRFSDARALGRLSDGVIMVVRASETSRDDAAAVYRRFHEDGTAVLGSILNDWNPRTGGVYGYRTSGKYEHK